MQATTASVSYAGSVNSRVRRQFRSVSAAANPPSTLSSGKDYKYMFHCNLCLWSRHNRFLPARPNHYNSISSLQVFSWDFTVINRLLFNSVFFWRLKHLNTRWKCRLVSTTPPVTDWVAHIFIFHRLTVLSFENGLYSAEWIHIFWPCFLVILNLIRTFTCFDLESYSSHPGFTKTKTKSVF